MVALQFQECARREYALKAHLLLLQLDASIIPHFVHALLHYARRLPVLRSREGLVGHQLPIRGTLTVERRQLRQWHLIVVVECELNATSFQQLVLLGYAGLLDEGEALFSIP